MSNLADIIAQETQDGRLIARFLLFAMDGDLTDFQPCHRIDAARLLVKLSFDQAQAAIDHARAAQRARSAAAPRQRDSRSQPQAQAQSQRQAESESQSAAHRVRAQLAQIVREETDDGRIAVRFLIDAMQGELPDFKPCHRLSAAKELLQRGFDYQPDDPDPQAEPEPVELTPEELEAAARRAPTMEHLIIDRDWLEDFLARYAEYLKQWNAEHPPQPHRLQPPPMDQPPLARLPLPPRPLGCVAPPLADRHSQPHHVIPAKAGIQKRLTRTQFVIARSAATWQSRRVSDICFGNEIATLRSQ